MFQGTRKKLFIGMKLNSELERTLEEKKVLVTAYIKKGDPDFLEIATIDGAKFLGKVMDPGLAAAAIPDIARHIRSVATKFCPHLRLSDDQIRVFVQEYIG
ncbi:MAG: hypothetical protein HY509_05310 [Acidobacteria bacterium]|nr:hypothetical protein [Acidobacteriota bacterium]